MNFEKPSGVEGEHVELGRELLEMAASDQDARGSGDWDRVKEIDHANIERLKAVIDGIGWPDASKVGSEAAHAAWLIVQHADADPAFQRTCLDMMRQAEEGISKEDLAYLEDRILVAEGKPQKYGTQFTEDAEGNPSPEPIDDMENLDLRRLEMGMEPYEEYRAAHEDFVKRMKGTKEDEP